MEDRQDSCHEKAANNCRLFSVFISLDAQTIYVDRLDPDGNRQIMTTGTKVKIEGYPYTFKLVAFTRGGASQWSLVVNSDLFISDYSEMLIKLANDEVIHLWAGKVSVSTFTTPERYITFHYGSISTTYVDPAKEQNHYTSFFPLTEEQIALIEGHSIKKIRISLGPSYLEKDSGLRKLSSWLSKGSKVIKERMQNPMVGPKSITDGF